MELTALLKQYNLPLTGTERALVNGLKSNSSSRPDGYYEQQLKQLADAREALKRLPDKKTSDRQKKSEKIKMLKDRLKMLKQMIPFMSPSAAKSLKAELKQIAAQIASLKDDSGSGGAVFSGSSDSAAGATVASSDAAGTAAEADAAATEAGVVTEAAEASSDTEDAENTDAGEKTGEPKDTETANAANSYQEQANQSKAESAADRAEKEELEKLKQLYQAVKNMLERKLQRPDDPATQAALQIQAYHAASEIISSSAVSIKG